MRQDIIDRYNKINKIDEVALKYIFKDYLSYLIKLPGEAAMQKGFFIHTLPDKKEAVSFNISTLLENLEQHNHIYSILNDGRFHINQEKLYLDGDTLEYCPTLGNLLVRIGLGYWVPWVTSREKAHKQFVIPKLLYEIGTEIIKNPPNP